MHSRPSGDGSSIATEHACFVRCFAQCLNDLQSRGDKAREPERHDQSLALESKPMQQTLSVASFGRVGASCNDNDEDCMALDVLRDMTSAWVNLWRMCIPEYATNSFSSFYFDTYVEVPVLPVPWIVIGLES